MNEPTLALLLGISYEQGIEHLQIFKKSVDRPKFAEYLEGLRWKNNNKKLTLFMDNLSVHKSEVSKDKMAELKIDYIFNVPYSPDWNPIEFCFAKIKRKFRSLRGMKMCGLKNESHEQLIV